MINRKGTEEILLFINVKIELFIIKKMDNLFEFAFQNKNEPEYIQLNKYIKDFMIAINKLDEKNLLDSDITTILSDIINKINYCLIEIMNKDLLLSNFYNMYDNFIIDLEKYGWQDDKFQHNIDIKKLKNNVNNYINKQK